MKHVVRSHLSIFLFLNYCAEYVSGEDIFSAFSVCYGFENVIIKAKFDVDINFFLFPSLSQEIFPVNTFLRYSVAIVNSLIFSTLREIKDSVLFVFLL